MERKIILRVLEANALNPEAGGRRAAHQLSGAAVQNPPSRSATEAITRGSSRGEHHERSRLSTSRNDSGVNLATSRNELDDPRKTKSAENLGVSSEARKTRRLCITGARS